MTEGRPYSLKSPEKLAALAGQEGFGFESRSRGSRFTASLILIIFQAITYNSGASVRCPLAVNTPAVVGPVFHLPLDL